MKRMARATLRGLIVALLAIGAGALNAQEAVIPATLAESQKGRFMCWAAVSMTAHRIVRKNEGIRPGLIDPDQRLLGLYNLAQDTTELFGNPFDTTRLTSEKVNAHKEELEAIDGDCPATGESLGHCDLSGTPILLDLSSERTADGEPLDFCQLRALMEAQRPVIFEWRGLKARTDSTTGRKLGAEGDHYLAVLGTRVESGTPEVLVWDPWVPRFSVAETQHLQWIPYTEFANPAADHGVVGEKHGVDYFQIRRKGRRKTPLPSQCDVAVPTSQPIASIPLPIDGIRREFLPDNVGRTMRSAGFPALKPGQRYGFSFPIVALTSAQIVARAASPPRSLGSESATVLTIVEDAAGKFDAVRTVLHGEKGWERRGYVSAAVAAALVEARKTHHARRREPRPASLADYYMVSIPSRRAFFVAYDDRQTGETMLIPIADQPEIGATAGKAQRARDLLLRIATDIEADWARQARARSDPVRSVRRHP